LIAGPVVPGAEFWVLSSGCGVLGASLSDAPSTQHAVPSSLNRWHILKIFPADGVNDPRAAVQK
jgi:hypothetical protein